MRSEVWRKHHPGWMGPQEVSSPISCSQHGQLWGQTGLLRAISKSAKDGECATSLGSLCHSLAVLMEDKVFLASDLDSSRFNLCLCSTGKSLSLPSWWLPVDAEGLLLGPPKTLFLAEQAQLPQPLLGRQLLQPLASLGSFCWIHFSEHEPCIGGPKTGCGISRIPNGSGGHCLLNQYLHPIIFFKFVLSLQKQPLRSYENRML